MIFHKLNLTFANLYFCGYELNFASPDACMTGGMTTTAFVLDLVYVCFCSFGLCLFVLVLNYI